MTKRTFRRLSISSTWTQLKANSIAKDSKQKRFFRFFFFSSISTVLTQDSFNDEEFELFVSQRFETSFSMTIFSSRNFFFSSRIISHFFEVRKARDSTQKIDKLNSKTKKTKANKFSIDELTKTQTKEQEIKTISFSISISFFFIDKDDTDDWFSFAKFSKVEEKIRDATNSKAENRERIKVESQNSQSKWMSFDRANSAKRQTAHTNSSLKLSSNSDFEISFQFSSFRDETDAKNSTKQINKISKSSQKSTFFLMMMMMMMMMITMIIAMIVVEREISKTFL